MSSQGTKILAGQWIVRLRPFSNDQVRTSHVSALETKTADANTPFDCQVQQHFDFPEFKGYSATFNDETKAQIEQMGEVTAVEPVRIYTHCKLVSQKGAPWGLQRISAAGKVGSAPHTYTYNDEAAGQNTVAYIIDTGINDTHVEFGGRASKGPKFVRSWITEGQRVSDDDKDGHGTHCAGTVGSAAYGVAKKAQIVGIKVFNDDREPGATNSDIIEAIQYVVKEAKRHGKKSVINLSLGGEKSEALDFAVAAAVRSGVVVCVAAGNDNVQAENESPAGEPLAVTVGATGISDTIPEWANYGKIVDILAPGLDILSCWIGSKTATNTISGTSMASPHVAGIACCLLSNAALKNVGTADIMSQILIQADKNSVSGAKLKERTINAVVQVNDL